MKTVPDHPEGKKELERKLQVLLRPIPEVSAAWIHGSFAMEDGRPARDIDLGILLAGSPTALEATRIELRMEQELQDALDLPLDVRVVNHAPLEFRFRVLERGRLIHEKDEKARVDHECMVYALYRDFKHHLDNYRREALGHEI